MTGSGQAFGLGASASRSTGAEDAMTYLLQHFWPGGTEDQ
jgi:hypothetical protein